MPAPRLLSRLLLTTLPAALVDSMPASVGLAQSTVSRVMNSYGLPGGVEMPTAEALPDGTLGGTVSRSDYGQRNNVVFQAMPRLTTALRYSPVSYIHLRAH